MKKLLLVTSFLTLIFSCGNPHLMMRNSSSSLPLNPGQEPDPTQMPVGVLKLQWNFNGDPDANFQRSRIEDVVSIYTTIKNTGDEVAILSSVELSSKDFTFSDYNNCLNQIKVQMSCTVRLQFIASTAGNFKSPLKLNFKDASGTLVYQLKSDLVGEKISGVLPPVISVSEFDAQNLDFEKVELGSSYSKFLEIINKNSNQLVVSIDDAIISNQEDYQFTGGLFPGTRGSCKKLMTQGSCLVEVTFKPKSIGKLVSNFKLVSGAQNLVSVNLTGYGVEKTQSICEKKEDYLFMAEGKFNTTDSSVIYPYLTKADCTQRKLSLLYGVETNKAYHCNNCEAVQDAMVLTRFNSLNWPKDQLVDAKIQVNVGKIHSSRNWLYTEMLCIQNNVDRLCSGELFSKYGEASWYALLNNKFFNTRPGPVNLEFNNLLFHDSQIVPMETKEGLMIDRSILKTTISLQKLYNLNLTQVENILRAGFVNVILTDDVKNISYSRLLVTAKKEAGCD